MKVPYGNKIYVFQSYTRVKRGKQHPRKRNPKRKNPVKTRPG
jgi:hypothetical protein